MKNIYWQMVSLYIVFAALATAINICTQELAILLYKGEYSIALSILAGTATGLIVKYILDQKYIFRYKTLNLGHNTSTFLLYSLMGIATTVIFWGTELMFHYLFETKQMRYLGGILGLTIGYYTKYQLDKKFVFINK